MIALTSMNLMENKMKKLVLIGFLLMIVNVASAYQFKSFNGTVFNKQTITTVDKIGDEGIAIGTNGYYKDHILRFKDKKTRDNVFDDLYKWLNEKD